MAVDAVASDEPGLQSRVARIETLIEGLERLPDPAAREAAEEAIQAVLEYHGAGLARILAHLEDSSPPQAGVLTALAGDELVSGLLLLHGLHPVPLSQRVEGALESVRPYMHSHGGDVELLGLEDDVVRLRLQGSCHGCPSSTLTLKLAVEKAIYEAAPDISGIEVEGVSDPPAPALPALGMVPLQMATTPVSRSAPWA